MMTSTRAPGTRQHRTVPGAVGKKTFQHQVAMIGGLFILGLIFLVAVAVAVACLPIFFTGGVISRQESALLLAYYIAYTLYLVLASSHHHALPRFSAVMLYFVIPLTAVTMATIAFREVRARGR